MADGELAGGARLGELTPRERDCLRLVVERHSSKEIARHLGISQTSVDTYVRRARDKLGLRDRYAAATLLQNWEHAGAGAIAPSSDNRGVVSGWTLRAPPLSSLNLGQRFALILAGAFAGATIFGALLTIAAMLWG